MSRAAYTGAFVWWAVLCLVATYALPIRSAHALTDEEANKSCRAWYQQCKGKPCEAKPPILVVNLTPLVVKCECDGPECRGTSATGLDGKEMSLTGALGFLNQALGLINNLKGLFQKPPAAPTAPLAPTAYPTAGSPCVSDGVSYPHTQAVVGGGCCGTVLTGTVLPICSRSAACPSVRMLCCSGQWLLATSTSAACPAAPVYTAYTDVFTNNGTAFPGALGTAVSESAKKEEVVESGTKNENITQNILDSLLGTNLGTSSSTPERALGEILKQAAAQGAGAKGEAPVHMKTKDATNGVRSSLSGTTFVAEVQGSGEGIAGFYGVPGGTGGATAQQNSVVGRLCVSRPWANSLVSWLTAPAFFDGLCKKYGYIAATKAPGGVVDTTALSRAVIKNTVPQQRGAPLGKGITCNPEVVREGSSVALTFSCGAAHVIQTGGFRTTAGATQATLTPSGDATYGIVCDDKTTHSCSVRIIRPRVAVWTEPKEVRLGTRAIVYWNTEDVLPDSCVIKGPSFLEHGLSGGAATVAINDAATYTIECTAIDGQPASAETTLELAL